MVEMDETADGSVHAIVAKQFSIYEVIFLMIDLGYFFGRKMRQQKNLPLASRLYLLVPIFK